MEIKELQKKDFQKVIEYAISGMHFEEYLTNKFMLNIYGRYFWYLEYINATQVIAAYEDKKLLGVLVADIKGEEKPYKSVGKGLYVKLIDIIQNLFLAVVLCLITKQTGRCWTNTPSAMLPMENFVF